MKEITGEFDEQLETRPGAPEDAIQSLLEYAGGSLPADYIEFLRWTNGAIGKGPDIFVILRPAEDVKSTTEGYEAPIYAPGLIVIGTDGLGSLLGIDARAETAEASRYVWMEAIGMGWDNVQARAPTLVGLFREMVRTLTEYNQALSSSRPGPEMGRAS